MYDMTPWQVIPLLVLMAGPADKGWVQATKEDGITVYSRKREDSNVAEMKAVGIIDASPQEVWSAIRDYDNYKTTMPYTEESRILSSEQGGKVILFYSVVNAPLVDRRDYVIRLVDESDWKDGKGYLLAKWKATDKGPPEKADLVRVKVNDGFWKLEPRENGTKTFATYYIYTDPGGSIPKWIVNRANSTAVPNVFKAIRAEIAKKKKK
jgi:hypothetical protein